MHNIAAVAATPIGLPIVEATANCRGGSRPPIRKSRNSRKRFTILVIVQLLMVAHVVQWLWMGTTLAPVEPSESMETLKHGIVTVGFIFFALAIASTAVLGRWFCGWGCHIVLLQDACSEWMKKVGIHPKPFRSRLLRYLPLALAIYMFVWPVAYRIAVAPFVQPDLGWSGISFRLITTDYWATFPGLWTAIPFLLVCGVLSVYFLGQKGYCTYACPYGGLFAPVDELAIGRIRVSDACDGCGHCTAVCTSNVRVHEEVAQYRMVVDPGCMKCLDCVSVCPKDALSFGFGAPAIGTAARAQRHRTSDLTLRAEIFVIAAALLALYGVYFPFGSSVMKFSLPLLFAGGVAICFAFAAWKALRIAKRETVGFHRWSLCQGGRIRAPGFVWLALTGFLALALADSLGTNIAGYLAYQSDLQVQVSEEAVFGNQGVQVPPELRRAATTALDWYTIGSPVWHGGASVAPADTDAIDLRRAWLHAVLGEFAQGEAILRDAYGRSEREPVAIGIARMMRAQRRASEADSFLAKASAAHPDWAGLDGEIVAWFTSEGKLEEAVAFCRQRMATASDATRAKARLASLLIDQGDTAMVEQGIALSIETLETQSANPSAHRSIASGYLRLRKGHEALAPLRRAIELSPGDPVLLEMLGHALEITGDAAGAQAARQDAAHLREGHPNH